MSLTNSLKPVHCRTDYGHKQTPPQLAQSLGCSLYAAVDDGRVASRSLAHMNPLFERILHIGTDAPACVCGRKEFFAKSLSRVLHLFSNVHERATITNQGCCWSAPRPKRDGPMLGARATCRPGDAAGVLCSGEAGHCDTAGSMAPELTRASCTALL